jgi:tetratricopeptide (TPR) repeat protein
MRSCPGPSLRCLLVAVLASTFLPVVVPASAQTAITPAIGSQASPAPAGVVVERRDARYEFNRDGTGTVEAVMRLRIEDGAAARLLGPLSFSYDSAFQEFSLESLEIRKPSGLVVKPGKDAVQDIALQVLPGVADRGGLRQLQVTLPGLGRGDVCTFRLKIRLRPQIPGHFSLAFRFVRGLPVLEENLVVDVPADGRVRLKVAPGFDPLVPQGEVSGERRIYTWRRSNAETSADLAAILNAATTAADVRVTTFASWADVAAWYLDATRERRKPNAAIRAKAAELTSRQPTPTEKLHSLYDFVGSHVRYVGPQNGAARLIPRPSGEVLESEYGDCKEQQVLLGALAEAAGIEIHPALVSVGRQIDPDFPTLDELDHVISVAPLGAAEAGWTWLDTSAGGAPFGLVASSLRGKKALVLTDAPRLVTVPARSPVPSYLRTQVDARLNELGTLDARVTTEIRGDGELLLRPLLSALPDAQRVAVAQSVASQLGLPDSVTDVEVSDPSLTQVPLSVRFRVRRPNWYDRTRKPATLVLPIAAQSTPYGQEKEWKGLQTASLSPMAEEVHSRVVIELPPGYIARPPVDVSVTRDYGQYKAVYLREGNRLSADRLLIQSTVDLPASRMRDYLAFVAAIRADEAQTIAVDASAATSVTATTEATTAELYGAGLQAYQAKDYTSAIALWSRLVKAEPAHKDAWDALGLAHIELKQWDEAVAALREQVRLDPFHHQAWLDLGTALEGAGKVDEAIAAWQRQVEIVPLDKRAHKKLGLLLRTRGEYKESVAALSRAAELTPDDAAIHTALGRSLLKLGDNDKGIQAFDRARKINGSAGFLSDLAYYLADESGDAVAAQEWARAAMSQAAADSMKIDLATATAADARRSWAISWAWHAFGWAAFKRGDLDTAERYLSAARSVRRTSEISAHLAETLEKAGQAARATQMHAEAAWYEDRATQMYAEAVWYEDNPAAKARLLKILGSEDGTKSAVRLAAQALWASRLIRLGKGPGGSIPAFDVLLVFANGSRVPELRALDTGAEVQPLLDVARKGTYPVIFPDDTPARILTDARVVWNAQAGEYALMLLFGSSGSGLFARPKSPDK